MVIPLIDAIGVFSLNGCRRLGQVGIFTWQALATMVTQRPRLSKVLYQMHYIGVSSISIVFLVGTAIGAVLALQSHEGLVRFGSTQFIGPIVFLSMAREFGPVFTALMVIGRAGSAMTAELGSMRISEQIDALETLCIDPYQYLVVPRIVASTVILPFLSMFCTFFGIFAGYVAAVYVLGINPDTYTEAIRENVGMSDLVNGLIKSVIFGFLFAIISTYKGYGASGGAKGLGIAITQSVVYSNVTIIIADYILTSLMFTK
ncbi:ABC transporter permease [bacterium]|nr:ABC transporter permease [bacterium]